LSKVFAPHARGLRNVTVRGFVMEHAANQWDDFFWLPRSQANNPSPAAFAQGGLLSTRSGHNWLVEHNVLRHAKVFYSEVLHCIFHPCGLLMGWFRVRSRPALHRDVPRALG